MSRDSELARLAQATRDAYEDCRQAKDAALIAIKNHKQAITDYRGALRRFDEAVASYGAARTNPLQPEALAALEAI